MSTAINFDMQKSVQVDPGVPQKALQHRPPSIAELIPYEGRGSILYAAVIQPRRAAG